MASALLEGVYECVQSPSPNRLLEPRLRRWLPIVIGLVLFALPQLGHAQRVRSKAAPKNLGQFVRHAKPTSGKQRYLAGRRVPALAKKLVPKKWGQKRRLVHVDNGTLETFTNSTKKGYLEVIIPANTGHVWFRHGEKLYDFAPGGFRVSGVRNITKERYGVLVKLSKKQEKQLSNYLERLESSKGAELGTYDFHGDKGFQCVTWFMRQSFGEGKNKQNLVEMLGGKAKHAKSMPAFANFMLKKAKGVSAVIVYNKDGLTQTQLDTKTFDVMTLAGLRRAFAETGRPD